MDGETTGLDEHDLLIEFAPAKISVDHVGWICDIDLPLSGWRIRVSHSPPQFARSLD